jgi:cytoplasmic iron level regulating protein YaaA (DUF328/UPF0246 family)
VLILLSASEGTTPVTRGKPCDPARLPFPSLAPTRAAVLDALADVSARPDALRRLDVPTSLVELVRANVTLGEAPAAPAATVYAGPLYDGLGLADLDAASRRRAQTSIVVVSALWGAVRLGDRIPAYRLNMCGRLPGLPHLPDVWRGPLTGVLPATARQGLVVDCRSAEYATAWRPSGDLAERTVVVRSRATSYDAKYLRGRLARRIVTDAVDPQEPEDLANALLEHLEVDLRRPARPGRSWELQVIAAVGSDPARTATRAASVSRADRPLGSTA